MLESGNRPNPPRFDYNPCQAIVRFFNDEGDPTTVVLKADNILKLIRPLLEFIRPDLGLVSVDLRNERGSVYYPRMAEYIAERIINGVSVRDFLHHVGDCNFRIVFNATPELRRRQHPRRSESGHE